MTETSRPEPGKPVKRRSGYAIFNRAMLFSIGLTLVFTLVANLLPQVEGEAPVEQVVDLGSLTMDDFVALGEVDFVLALPAVADAQVDGYDVRGRHVRSLLAGVRPAGVHPTHWDARDSGGRRVAAGVYFVRAHAGSEREIHKVVILD